MTPNELEEKRESVKRESRVGITRNSYPAAVESNGITFVAALGGVDESGKVVSRDPAEQTTRAIENLKAVLSANGQGLEHVIKCTIYLIDLRHLDVAKQILKTNFQNCLPACSWIGVSALPEDQVIAIEAIAGPPTEGKDVYDFMG